VPYGIFFKKYNYIKQISCLVCYQPIVGGFEKNKSYARVIQPFRFHEMKDV